MYKPSLFNIRCVSRSGTYILLFNTLTTRLLKVPVELDAELSMAIATGRGDVRLLSKLCEGGFLVPEAASELDTIAKRREMAQSPDHAFLSILTTLDCNMACPYCFEAKRDDYMDHTDGRAILDFLSRLPDRTRFLAVDWYGGEPLMNYDFICWLQPQIRELVISKNIVANFSITTNGTLLSEDRIYSLVAMGIGSFQMTVDGPPNTHDRRRALLSGQSSFSQILEHIRLASCVTHVVIRVNVDRDNIDSLYELIDILREAGLHRNTHLVFKEITPARGIQNESTYTPMEFAMEIQPIEAYAISQGFVLPCAPRTTGEHCPVDSPFEFMLTPGLSVFKCGESCLAEDESIGVLSEAGEMFLNARYCTWTEKTVLEDPECQSCVYLPQCMGGCSLKKIFHRCNWCPREKFNLEWYVQCLCEQRESSRMRRN